MAVPKEIDAALDRHSSVSGYGLLCRVRQPFCPSSRARNLPDFWPASAARIMIPAIDA
jgi:hypothetical protein